MSGRRASPPTSCSVRLRRARGRPSIHCARPWADPEIRYLAELYAAWDDTLLDIVRNVEPEARALLLVGHNPGLQSLAVRLAGSGDGDLRRRLEEKLPTGALVTLTFRADSWAAVGPGSGGSPVTWSLRELR